MVMTWIALHSSVEACGRGPGRAHIAMFIKSTSRYSTQGVRRVRIRVQIRANEVCSVKRDEVYGPCLQMPKTALCRTTGDGPLKL